MKRNAIVLLFVVLIAGMSSNGHAQNYQVLYDTGRDCVTTTFEMFKPDAFGNTFCFVDVDFSPRASLAYTEISRELCFWQDTKWDWLSVHVEFDGGFELEKPEWVSGYSYENCWLLGLTYSGHSDDFSKTWSFSAMYKGIPGAKGFDGKDDPHSFQLTGVWGMNFLNNWCSFSGFADFWRQVFAWQGTEYVFMTVPQLWVNLNNIKGWDNVHLSLGGEVEISNNFVKKGFIAQPAFGAKWTF